MSEMALKKVGVRQYEDSVAKPGVGISTQARPPPKGIRRQLQLLGVRVHAPPVIICFRESFKCLLVISKGTFQALKNSFFFHFFLDIYHCRQNRICFSSEGETCQFRRHDDRSETLTPLERKIALYFKVTRHCCFNTVVPQQIYQII